MGIRQWLMKEPILLSHHPLCERFEEHVVTIKGVPLCRGCLIVYPTAAAVLLSLYLLRMHLHLTHWEYLIASFVFFSVNAARKLLALKGAAVQNVSRACLGASLALAVMAVLRAPTFTSKAVVMTVVLASAITFNVVNGIKTLRTCRGCPDHANFPLCSDQRVER